MNDLVIRFRSNRERVAVAILDRDRHGPGIVGLRRDHDPVGDILDDRPDQGREVSILVIRTAFG